jgi:hypothetical protein
MKRIDEATCRTYAELYPQASAMSMLWYFHPKI